MITVSSYSRTQKLIMLTSRRGRGVSSVLVLLILAVPAAFVTILLPAITPTETWYIAAVDTTLISIFLIWRLIVLTGNALRQMQARPNIARMVGGDHLIHWLYSPEEWQRFAEIEYRRDREVSQSFITLRQGVIGSILFGGLVTGVLLAINASEAAKPGGRPPYPADALLLIIPLAVGMPLAITVFQIVSLYLGDRRSDYQRRRRVPEIYVNQQGVNGLPTGYMPLPARNTRVTVNADESVIEIEITKIYYSKGGAYPQVKVERLLIPQGKEAEARGLHRYFPKSRL